MQFRYTARRSDGQLAQGTVEANDRAGAVLLVEQQRCFPIKIEAVAVAVAAAGAGGRKEARGSVAAPEKGSARGAAEVDGASAQSISLSGQFLFTEQLGHLLSAGMTLDEALGILVRRMRQPGLQELCKTLHQALVDGQSLSQAMRQFPKVFTPLYVNMVSAGEVSGALPTIMKRLVVYLGGGEGAAGPGAAGAGLPGGAGGGRDRAHHDFHDGDGAATGGVFHGDGSDAATADAHPARGESRDHVLLVGGCAGGGADLWRL